MVANRSRIINLVLLRHDRDECRQPLYKKMPAIVEASSTMALWVSAMSGGTTGLDGVQTGQVVHDCPEFDDMTIVPEAKMRSTPMHAATPHLLLTLLSALKRSSVIENVAVAVVDARKIKPTIRCTDTVQGAFFAKTVSPPRNTCSNTKPADISLHKRVSFSCGVLRVAKTVATTKAETMAAR